MKSVVTPRLSLTVNGGWVCVSSQAEDMRRDNERPRRMKKGTFSWASFGFFISSRLVNDRLRFFLAV